MFCPRCGQQNSPDDRVCRSCGAALSRPGDPVGVDRELDPTSTMGVTEIDSPAAQEPDVAGFPDGVVDSLPDGSAMLVVSHGPNAGSRFLLDQDVTAIGRHPDSDVFLDDVTVSRRHAEVHRTRGDVGTTFTVHDVGSLNGTYLHRERVDEAQMVHRDPIQIGKFRLVFIRGGR